MRKIFTFVTLLALSFGFAQAECQDGPYGLKINGTTIVDAPKFGDPDAQGRVQYKAACVDLKVGDEIMLVNQSCDATWMVDLDPYGEYQNFEGGKSAGKLTCKKEGKYDFYIKLSAKEGDLVYVGPGQDCGGSNPGGFRFHFPFGSLYFHPPRPSGLNFLPGFAVPSGREVRPRSPLKLSPPPHPPLRFCI